MPQLDITTFSSQIFWLVVTFTALFLVIWRISVPKISETLEARQKRINDNLVRAEELKRDAEAAIESYEASLNQAHQEAHHILLEAKTKLTRESQIREAAVNEALAKRIQESEKNIESAIDAAISQIRDAATEVAASAVERLSGEKPNDNDTRAAVDAVLNNR